MQNKIRKNQITDNDMNIYNDFRFETYRQLQDLKHEMLKLDDWTGFKSIMEKLDFLIKNISTDEFKAYFKVISKFSFFDWLEGQEGYKC